MQHKTLADVNIFASRLKSLQKGKGVTSRSISAALGVSEPTVSQWRSGRHMPERSLWEPLCDLLDTTIDDLFFSRSERFAKTEVSEPPAPYPRRLRERGSLGSAPPGASVPRDPLTRDRLLRECMHYLEQAEAAGALSVAALQIRKHLKISDFDYFDHPPPPSSHE